MAAAPVKTCFVLPLPSENAQFECTEPLPRVYLLRFHSPPDNRLTQSFCDAFGLALDIIEQRYPRGVLVTSSTLARFYSNGLDFQKVLQTPNYLGGVIYPLWHRILTYPMPTVALINGHAFAGGLMLAAMHDYRIMNPHKGFLCLNELEFGAPLRPAMASIFREKVPRPDTFRALVLEAKRFNALQALEAGLVDGLGGWEAAVTFIQEINLTAKAESKVYGQMKEEMWRETADYLQRGEPVELREVEARQAMRTSRAAAAKESVERWERSARNGSPKL